MDLLVEHIKNNGKHALFCPQLLNEHKFSKNVWNSATLFSKVFMLTLSFKQLLGILFTLDVHEI